MTYGIIRTSIGFYPKSYELKKLGIISYLVEAFCFEYESFVSNNLHKNYIYSYKIEKNQKYNILNNGFYKYISLL